MENASKALIIAGAILLAILLISLGILIFNQAQDTVNNSGMSQAEITALNNRFLKYEGEQSATAVKSLMNEVFAYNQETNHKKIKVLGQPASNKAGTEQNNTVWVKLKKYNVKIYSYYDEGTIQQIRIYAIDD